MTVIKKLRYPYNGYYKQGHGLFTQSSDTTAFLLPFPGAFLYLSKVISVLVK